MAMVIEPLDRSDLGTRAATWGILAGVPEAEAAALLGVDEEAEVLGLAGEPPQAAPARAKVARPAASVAGHRSRAAVRICSRAFFMSGSWTCWAVTLL